MEPFKRLVVRGTGWVTKKVPALFCLWRFWGKPVTQSDINFRSLRHREAG